MFWLHLLPASTCHDLALGFCHFSSTRFGLVLALASALAWTSFLTVLALGGGPNYEYLRRTTFAVIMPEKVTRGSPNSITRHGD